MEHGYCACMSFLDAQLGVLLDELDRLGLTDGTIVALWADHGGSAGMLSHAPDATFRVPLMIRDPRRRRDGRTASVILPRLVSSDSCSIRLSLTPWIGMRRTSVGSTTSWPGFRRVRARPNACGMSRFSYSARQRTSAG